VAAPVFNHLGHVVASIGVSGASSQMNPEQLEEAKTIVVDVAIRLSSNLGHVEPQ
jgi:DNA-binding IclR family transcriptional regulator